MNSFQVPKAPQSIKKGVPLKLLLDKEAALQMSSNIQTIFPNFNCELFLKKATDSIEELGIKERALHFAKALKTQLPDSYLDSIDILLKSLSPALEKTEGNGLAGLFYMPHCTFIETFGVDPIYSKGIDPFEASMGAQYELTQRFTCEYSIRAFLKSDEERTLEYLYKWMHDANPHVRRLSSEGTRPRLPWSSIIDSFTNDPTPTIKILEQLKNDPDLYVRRSVANHLGDIAKDHLDLSLDICKDWLKGSSKELKWVIRHALRYPVKKGIEEAIEIRALAK